MKQKIVIISVLLLAMIGIVIVVGANQADAPDKANLILYYSDTCPHCKIVEDFIAENNIIEKTGLISKEVYYDETNARELYASAKSCKISTDQVGIPFLWDKGECVAGDQPIIEHLKKK